MSFEAPFFVDARTAAAAFDLPEFAPETTTIPVQVGREPLSASRAARLAHVVAQMTHALCVPEDAGQLKFETDRIHEAFQPRNGWQDWLTCEIATILFRLTRCSRIERKLRDMASYRAIQFWEDDQQLAAETLALKLMAQPARTVAQLRETPAGIDCLLHRWQDLAQLPPDAWTEPHKLLAAALLGGDLGINPTAPDFIAARTRELTDRRARVEEADRLVRALVEADMSDDGVAGLTRLRRYSRSLHRQLKWYVDQFHVEHPDRWDDPRRQPGDISYDLMAQQKARQSTYSFAEPSRPAPTATNPTANVPINVRNETKPFTVGRSAPGDETKPLADDLNPSGDETKPLLGAALPLADETKPPAPVSTPTAVHDYATERGRNHSRPHQAGDHSREYTRRTRAARRKTSLALAELS